MTPRKLNPFSLSFFVYPSLCKTFYSLLFTRYNAPEVIRMVYSKISKKGQLTIPKEMREELDLTPGDRIKFELDDEELRLRKVESFDEAYHQATEGTLNEWMSEADDEAYNDL